MAKRIKGKRNWERCIKVGGKTGEEKRAKNPFTIPSVQRTKDRGGKRGGGKNLERTIGSANWREVYYQGKKRSPTR